MYFSVLLLLLLCIPIRSLPTTAGRPCVPCLLLIDKSEGASLNTQQLCWWLSVYYSKHALALRVSPTEALWKSFSEKRGCSKQGRRCAHQIAGFRRSVNIVQLASSVAVSVRRSDCANLISIRSLWIPHHHQTDRQTKVRYNCRIISIIHSGAVVVHTQQHNSVCGETQF